MAPLLQQIKKQALRLPPQDRELLASTLLQSLEDVPPDQIEEAWIDEAERRYQDWRSGKSQGVPDAQFFAEMRRELGWH